MPNSEKPRRTSHVDPKDDPDEHLRRELLRIANGDYEGPNQRTHARRQAIAERSSLELRRVADIARVPPGQRDRLAGAILDVVLDAWENNDEQEAASQLGSTNAALSRAIEALRAAKRALADLDENDREGLSWPISEIEGGIDRLFEWVVGGPKLTQPQSGPKPTRRRRPVGSITNWPFQIFVRDLLLAASGCGGRLTLNHTNETGTLIDAIEILRPCLPERLVPRALPLTTMKKIKAKSAKRR
jgi:hypothetical protein